MKGLFLINILLALAWIAVSGGLTVINFIFGFMLGAFALWVIRDQTGFQWYFVKLYRVFALMLLFIYELILSSFRMLVVILFKKQEDLVPGFIACDLNVESDFEITLLANLITLTPGTLSVDISDDKSTLYIHTIDVHDIDQLRTDIALGFEQKIKKAFGS